MALRSLFNTVHLTRSISTSAKFHLNLYSYQNRQTLFWLNQNIAQVCRDYQHNDKVALARGYLAEYINKADPIEWSNWIQYKEDKYSKIQIVKPLSSAYSIYLLSWLPGQASPIHGHPLGECVMAILQGSLVETVYSSIKLKPLSYKKQIRILTPGKIGYIDDSIGYHSIANVYNIPCNSLHIYFHNSTVNKNIV